MKMHTCVGDKVAIIWEANMVSRKASTSHNLHWILDNSAGFRAIRPMSTARYVWDERVREVNGIINVEMGIRIPDVFAASELAQYDGAVTMCFNFERGILRFLENSIMALIRSMAAALEVNRNVAQTCNLQTVSGAMVQISPTVHGFVRRKISDYNLGEMQGLKDALENRLAVPHSLLFGGD